LIRRLVAAMSQVGYEQKSDGESSNRLSLSLTQAASGRLLSHACYPERQASLSQKCPFGRRSKTIPVLKKIAVIRLARAFVASHTDVCVGGLVFRETTFF